MPKRKSWSAEAMRQAVDAVRKKEMGYLKASKQFNVPKTTIKDYVKNEEKTVEQLINSKLGRKAAIPDLIEQDLVNYCLEMDKRFYGLSSSDITRLAYQLAIKNGLSHPFSKKKGAAGKKWLKRFLTRHPQIAFRKPQALSIARIKGFTKENVDIFFDIFEKAMEKIKYNPSRLYNVDETGITTVQTKCSRVLSLKGKKQVGAVSSAERGALITVVTCMNATSGFVPPMMIFPRKNMKQELLDGAPPGTIAACHPSGWIQQHIFTQWLQHFIKHVKPSAEDSVLLVLDGHYSHTRNMDVIDIARANHVIIVCLPPHSTHKMQPLDLSFMAPLKTYYSQEIQTWLRNHPGRTITAFQVAALLGNAYLRTATAEVSANGFRKSGLFPCNRHVFRDSDFAIHHQRERTPTPEENHADQGEKTPPRENHPLTETQRVQAEDISPLPSCSKTHTKSNARNNKKGKAALITGTPYKDDLSDSLTQQGRKKRVTLAIPKMKTAFLVGGKKKKILEESDSESSVEDLQLDDDSDMDVEDEDDAECMFCNGLYSEDTRGEKWIKCLKCFKWGHEECANSDNKDAYVCGVCLNG